MLSCRQPLSGLFLPTQARAAVSPQKRKSDGKNHQRCPAFHHPLPQARLPERRPGGGRGISDPLGCSGSEGSSGFEVMVGIGVGLGPGLVREDGMLSLCSWPGGLENQGAVSKDCGAALPSQPHLPWAGLRPFLSVPCMKCLSSSWFAFLSPAVIFPFLCTLRTLTLLFTARGAPWSSWHQTQDLNFSAAERQTGRPLGVCPASSPVLFQGPPL